MPKTVRALVLAALFLLGGTATAHAADTATATATAASAGAATAGRTAEVPQIVFCMAC